MGIAVLGICGYFGYAYWQSRQEKAQQPQAAAAPITAKPKARPKRKAARKKRR